MPQFQNKITQINVELGFIRINKTNLEYFPKGKESLKITGIIEVIGLKNIIKEISK